MEENLPKGWEWRRLCEVATVGAGNGAPQGEQYFIDGKYPFVRTQDVGREKTSICLVNTTDKVNDLAVKEFHPRLWPAKTLLIPKSGASTFLNHRALLGVSSYVSSHLATVTPGNDLLPEYLYFWSLTLDSKQLTPDINYPSLRLSELGSARIPKPPLKTQRRIVAILKKAVETKRLRAQADELTNRFLQSVFLEMFGDPVKNPKGWIVKRADELTFDKSSIGCGPFGSQLKIGEYVEEGIPVLGIDNVAVNKFVWAKPKNITRKKYEQLKAFSVKPEDILISRTGTVGRTCVVPKNFGDAVIGPNLLKVTLDKDIMSPEFFSTSLSYFPSMIEQIQNLSPGATVPVFNTKNLKALKIVVPPLPLQQKFAHIIEKIESMRQSQNQSKQQIEDLFSALMQKSFKGELVA